MSVFIQEIFGRLGREGLLRVLEDVLDRKRLDRLANTCGLKYPGMRTRSQKRETLIADLADRALAEESTGKAVYRLLEKETATELRRWTGLPADEKASRLGDRRFLLTKGNLGRHLFFLACTDADKAGDAEGFESLLARQHLLGLAANGRAETKVATEPSREAARLTKRITELQKKVQHLEAQLAKSRETEKTFKRDLIQHNELAESRTLIERLNKDRALVAKASPAADTDESVRALTKTIKRLSSEQRKLAHAVAHPPELPVPPSVNEEILGPVVESLKLVQRELGAARRDHKRDQQLHSKQFESFRETIEKSLTAPRSKRSTSPERSRAGANGAERVGVFIDVQNMHYGARKLKGKLDFDALLSAAVRDRRLVQATAYVVESKEIDQTGFIGILQRRAIEVRRKQVQIRVDGSMKGDWDMELALDILDAASGLDVVVLVSGDGDFTSLVQRVKKMGPRVEVIAFPRNAAKSLVGAADEFQPLDRKFMIYPKPMRQREAAGSKARSASKEPRTPRSKPDPAPEPAESKAGAGQ